MTQAACPKRAVCRAVERRTQATNCTLLDRLIRRGFLKKGL